MCAQHGQLLALRREGMSWSEKGALSLLKIKETILNNEWDLWWEKGRGQNIKVDKYKLPLPAAYFNREIESSPKILPVCRR